MKARLFLGGVLGLVIAAGLFWLAVPRRAVAVAGNVQASEGQALDPIDELKSSSVRTAVEVPDVVPADVPPEPFEERVTADATGGERVIARVYLQRADGQAPNFAGEVVTAQTWSRHGDQTFAHEALIGPDGVAEFEFPTAVHLDWFRFVPAAETGLAMRVADFHMNLASSSLFETTLLLGKGGSVRGRVELADGSPLAGTAVYAYFDTSGVREGGHPFGEWYPPHAVTATLDDGSFEFPNIGSGGWYIAVPPNDWLQIAPNLEDEVPWFEIEDGSSVEGPTYRVVQAHSFDVRVVDTTGAPAARVSVRLRPIQLRSPHLFDLPDGQDEGGERFEAWLAGSDSKSRNATFWPYEELEFMTAGDGHVACVAAAGTWELFVHAALDDGIEPYRKILEVPAADQVITLSSLLADLEGTVVDDQEEPLDGAWVNVTRGRRHVTTVTDREGRFVLPGMPAAGPLRIHIGHVECMQGTWEYPGIGAEPLRFELHRGLGLTLRVRQTDGTPLDRTVFKILSASPIKSSTEMSQEAVKWFANARNFTRSYSSFGANDVRIPRLYPGEYQVALMMYDFTGGLDGWGGPMRKRRPWKTWTLSAGTGTHELTVDLDEFALTPEPAHSKHSGTVRDARTGEGLAAARMIIRWPDVSPRTTTMPDGSFSLSGPIGTASATVTLEGYLPLYGEAFDYGEGLHRHDYTLVPGGQDVMFHFSGKNGGGLPDLTVRVHDTAGRRLLTLATKENGDRYWASYGKTHRGRLELGGLPAQPLRLVLTVDGVPFAEASVDIPPTSGVQEIEIHIDQTVEELREAMLLEFSADPD